jgi:hypothetical protein
LVLGPRVDGIRVGESVLGILVVGLEGFMDGMMTIALDAMVGTEVV